MSKLELFDTVKIIDKNSPYYEKTGVLCVLENEQYEVWLHTINGWNNIAFLKEQLEFDR